MEGFLGEVRIFAGNFAPRSWAFCEGQLLPISSNSALFSILGTIYGGDGRTTFALPDLRGRAPIGQGNGPGLSDRREGAKGGRETNTLTTAQIPSHNHSGTIHANNGSGTTGDPTGQFPAGMVGRTLGTPPENVQASVYATGGTVNMNSGSLVVSNTGGGQSVNNMQPWIAIYYIIALQGTYPSRS